MSPDRDPGRFDDDGREELDYDDDAPRSIFSTLWFRALLTVLVLGVLAAVAVPYVLDYATSPTPRTLPKSAAVTPAVPAPPAATAAPVVTPAVPDSTQASAAAPPVETARPRSEPPSAAKSTKAPVKPAPAKPAMVAQAVEPPKAAPAPKAAEAPRTAETPKRPATAPETSAAANTPKAAAATPGGSYWVQVGAFKEAETAKRLAARLREQGFQVEEAPMKTAATPRPSPAASSATVSPPADRYDVVVSGASQADVDARLASKGLRGETVGSGVVVRPSLALREAVSLSRDLADAGLSVQVRRVAGTAPAAAAPAVAPAPPPAPAGGETLHRVRVGGFPDRAAAAAAMKKLEDKGFKPFIARGHE